MSILKRVEAMLAQVKAEEKKQSDAIQRAEELADKFSDVKPKTDIASPERYMGLPAFQNEKNAC